MNQSLNVLVENFTALFKEVVRRQYRNASAVNLDLTITSNQRDWALDTGYRMNSGL
jgi:hypothetical protein